MISPRCAALALLLALAGCGKAHARVELSERRAEDADAPSADLDRAELLHHEQLDLVEGVPTSRTLVNGNTMELTLLADEGRDDHRVALTVKMPGSTERVETTLRGGEPLTHASYPRVRGGVLVLVLRVLPR